MIENGSVFLSILEADGGLTVTWEVKVFKVTMISPTRADVRYAIVPEGQIAVPSLTGVAVLVKSRWLVSTATMCGLLAYENAGNRSELPAICRTPAGLVS